MTYMKIVQFSRPPPPLSIYIQNSSTPLILDIYLQIITNQLKENIIQGWLLYVIRPFLQVDFHFQCQLINLIWLSFDFLSFSWSLTICFFVSLYFCVCSCPNNITECLLFITSCIFSSHFAINLFHLHNLSTHNCIVHVNKIKTKAKPSQVTFKLATHSIVWFSPQTMQWYH